LSRPKKLISLHASAISPYITYSGKFLTLFIKHDAIGSAKENAFFVPDIGFKINFFDFISSFFIKTFFSVNLSIFNIYLNLINFRQPYELRRLVITNLYKYTNAAWSFIEINESQILNSYICINL
jgi:hypothetical protein